MEVVNINIKHIVKSKGRKGLIALVALCGILFPIQANAYSQDNGKMWYSIGEQGVYNIKGYYNSRLYQTTYSDNGYGALIYVDGSQNDMSFSSNGDTRNYNGIDVTFKITPISGGNYLKIEYICKNTTSSTKRISIVGGHSDTQIGDNDRAPIYSLDGNTGMRMTDGSAQFIFVGRDSYGVTDVDHYWYGQYNDRTSHFFDDRRSNLSGTDSGMTYSWQDRNISPGETQKYSTLIGIGELNYPPSITINTNVDRGYYSHEIVPISGSVSNKENEEVTIKYALDDGTEYEMPQKIRPNGRTVEFNTNFSVPDTTEGNHNLKIWAVDEKGNMSKPTSVNVYVKVDKTPPSGSHNVSTTAWTNGNVNIHLKATDTEKGVRRIKLPNGSYANSDTIDYTATSNGSYTFILEDAVGNSSNYTVNVNNIDKTAPVLSINPSETKWTNKDIKLKINVGDNGSGVSKVILPNGNIVTSNTTEYVVSSNGVYKFEVIDKAGNKTTKSITINNIDKDIPTYNRSYVENITKDGYDVIIDEVSDKPNFVIVGETKISGIDRVIFSTWTEKNGKDDLKQIKGEEISDGVWKFHVNRKDHNNEYGNYSTQIIVYDKAGNSKLINAKQINLDNISPELIVKSTETDWVKEKVTIEVNSKDENNGSGLKRVQTPDGVWHEPNMNMIEPVCGVYVTKKSYNSSYEVTKNGTYTFIAEDEMGNVTKRTINIQNIDDKAPKAVITSNPEQFKWTNKTVTLNIKATDVGLGVDSIKLPNGNIMHSDNLDYVVNANGTYDFEIKDKAGNLTKQSFVVKNIDTTNPTAPKIITKENWNNDKQVLVTIIPGTDGQSGVKGVQYKLEGAEDYGWRIYDKPFYIEKEGVTKIIARTIDNVSQLSITVNATVKIDRTAPEEDDITIVRNPTIIKNQD